MSIDCELAFPEAASDLDWWQKTVIYQIYPRSFQDSNGDGIGDLNGITQRLDHFQYLGVETLWLSPFYKSPMKDFGYDISDFRDVDPTFGSLDDFKHLIKEVHDRGMKLILDYIPNHSSDLHPWFIESCKGGTDNPYSDYYVWHDGKLLPDGTRVPPNNWPGIFGGSAWTWVESRQQFYFHQYLAEQPDLNWRNPVVKQEMQDVFQYWLDLGADGFRIDAIATMFETEDVFQDELPDPNRDPSIQPDEYHYYEHKYSRHQPENYTIVSEWREFFNQYEAKTGKPHILLVTEAYDWGLKHVMGYYETGADCPFNFNLVAVDKDTNAKGVYRLVDSWLKKMPNGKWANWVTGNHDRNRPTTRKGAEYADTMNMLLLLLPGTPTTYQGEEIAMLDIEVSYEDTQDPHGKNFGPDRYMKFSRDPCRSPMQWSAEKNAGFSSAECTWLPVHPDYRTHNVQVQKNVVTSQTSLTLYKDLIVLRQQPSFQYGAMYYGLVNDNIFSFVRLASKHPPYMAVLHFGHTKSTVDLSACVAGQMFSKGKIVLQTPCSSQTLGADRDLTSVTLTPGQGLVYQLA